MELEWRHAELVQHGYEFEESAEYAAEADGALKYPFMTADNWDQCYMDLGSSEESDGSSQYGEDACGPAERGGSSGARPESGAESEFPTEYTEYPFMAAKNGGRDSVLPDNAVESIGPVEYGQDSNVPPKNSAKSCGPEEHGDSCHVLAKNGAESGARLPKGTDRARSANWGKALPVTAKNQFWSDVLSKWHRTGVENQKKTTHRGQGSRRRNRYLNSKARSKKKQAAKNAIKYAINRKCRELSKAADETEPEPGWAERQKEKVRAWRAEREAKPDWAESQLKFILEWRLMKVAYFYRQYERAIKKAGLFRTPKPLTPFEKPGNSAFYKAKLREKAFFEDEKARVRKWAQEVWGPTVIHEQPKDVQANLVHAGNVEDVTPSIEMSQNYLLRTGPKDVHLNLLRAAIAKALAPSNEMIQTPPMHTQPNSIQPNLMQNTIFEGLAPSIERTQTFLMHVGPRLALHQAPPDIKPVLLSAPKKREINLSLPGVRCNLVTANSGRLEVLRQAPLNLNPGLLETPKNMQPDLSQEVVGKDLAPTYPMHMGRQAHMNLKPSLLETPRILPLDFPIRKTFSLV